MRTKAVYLRTFVAGLLCMLLLSTARTQTAEDDLENAIHALIRTAESDPPLSTRYVANEFRRIGRAGVKPLVNLLHHENHSVQLLALNSLTALGDESGEAVPELIELLQDEAYEVRGRAAWTLGLVEHDPDRSIPPLIALLRDDESYPRSMAGSALSRFKTQSDAIVERLKTNLASDDFVTRRGASDGLRYFVSSNDELAPPIAGLLNDPEPTVRLAALQALRYHKYPKPETLRTVMRLMREDADVDIRLAAGHCIGNFTAFQSSEDGLIEPELIAALLEALQKDEAVCLVAARALHAIGTPGQDALVGAVPDMPLFGRLAVARAFSERNEFAESVRPFLLGALEDEHPQIRGHAALALVKTEDAPDEVEPLLRDLFADQTEATNDARQAAVFALQKLGVRGVAGIAVAAQDSDPYIRELAVQRLSWLEASDEDVVPILARALQDEHPGVRNAALDVVTRIRLGLHDVMPLLDDEDMRVRLKAAALLADAEEVPSNDEAAKVLLDALDSEDIDVRYSAGAALAKTGRHAAEVIPLLAAGLRTREGIQLLNAYQVSGMFHAIQAFEMQPSCILSAYILAAVGPPAGDNDTVQTSLEEMLRDPEAETRHAALIAIPSITPNREEWMPALGALLEHGDDTDRRCVIEALIKMGTTAKLAGPALEQIYAEEKNWGGMADWALETVLADELAEYRSEFDFRLIQSLLGLGSDDSSVGGPAYRFFDGSGQELLPDLVRLMSDKKYRLRERAAEALTIIGPDLTDAGTAVPPLIGMIEHPFHYSREVAVRALGEIGAPAEMVLPTLLQVLKEDESFAAAQAILKLGPDEARVAMPDLVEALRNPKTSWGISNIINQIGPDSSYVPTLVEILEDGDSGDPKGCRHSAANVLVQMGPSAASAAPRLVELLTGEDPELRRYAARILGSIGPEANAAIAVLHTIAMDKREDWLVRVVCAGALKCLQPDSAEATTVLREGLSRESFDMRYETLNALALVEPIDEGIAAALGEALSDTDETIQRMAIQKLQNSGAAARPALDAIRAFAKDTDNYYHYYALEILKSFGESVE